MAVGWARRSARTGRRGLVALRLGAAAVGELRLLGNLETRRGVALFPVLVARPVLRETLRRPGYEPFAQRIAVRAAVEPLSPGESADYLRHQLRAAGAEADVFD